MAWSQAMQTQSRTAIPYAFWRCTLCPVVSACISPAPTAGTDMSTDMLTSQPLASGGLYPLLQSHPAVSASGNPLPFCRH